LNATWYNIVGDIEPLPNIEEQEKIITDELYQFFDSDMD
jgi:hypothetical protein